MTNNTDVPANDTVQKTSASYLVLPIWILAVIMLCAMLEEAASIFLWIASAFFLTALLDPLLVRMRRHIPGTLATLLLVFFSMVLACGFIFAMAHFSAQMVTDLENSKKIFLHYYHNLRHTWNSWSSILSPPSANAHGTTNVSGAAPQPAAGSSPVTTPGAVPVTSAPSAAPAPSSGGGGSLGDYASTLARGVGSFVGVLVYAFLIPVLAFFMMTERDHMGRVIQKAMKEPSKGPDMWQRIVVATRAYFAGNLLLGVVSFPILTGLFFAFGVPSPLTLAALASVFNLIPFLGAVLSGFLPALALLSTGAHIGTVISLYSLCAMFHMILANFVTPKVLGKRLNVNATTSTLALVIGGEMLGGVGLLLAIPMIATLKIMFETSDLRWLKWIAALMNEETKKS